MRAALCRELGDPEVVRVEDVERPHLGPGQVRVRVGAASVNYPDVLIVAGKYQMSVPLPFVPGSELAGEVIEVAADVDRPRVGDRVFGSTIAGAFAEEAVLAARSVTVVPDGIDDVEAACFGVAHRTAYHVLRSVARLQSGDELIVLGAGGGVGLAAVQLGAHLGARVTAVAAGEEKLRVATALGAANVVNREQGSIRDALRALLPAGADVVIDPVGGGLSEPALRTLRWGGRFVTVGFASGEIPCIPLNLVLLKGVHVLGFQMIDFVTRAPEEQRRDEQELLELLRTGVARPHIGAVFPLDDVAGALRHVADGRAIGKVAITTGPAPVPRTI